MLPSHRARYTSIRFFILLQLFVLGLVACASYYPALTHYQALGWISGLVFGGWSYGVLRIGASILDKNEKDPFFLTFQMAVTAMKFFLLLAILLLYLKVFSPPDHSFAWYLLLTFLPFFIYETWAFSGMSKSAPDKRAIN